VKIGLFKPLLLLVLLGGGVVFYKTSMRPEPQRLSAWAERALVGLFGPHITHGRVEVDILSGVRIQALSVQGPGDAEPTLFAEEVEIRHDVLALTAGVARLREIGLRGIRISAHETDAGELELDFPFDPPKDAGGKDTPLPRIVIDGGTFRLRASPKSQKFRTGAVLELGGFHAIATPAPTGGWTVNGGFAPVGLGVEPGEEITFYGTGDPDRGTLDVYALWARLRLTREVRELLAPALLERLDAQRLTEGPHRLAVRVVRDPAVEEGRIQLRPEFKGEGRMDVAGLPGTENIDARTKEQINDLFGKIQLTVEVSGNRVDIRELTTSLAGGDVKAAGKVEDGGEVVDVDLLVSGLRLEDPALRKALGAIGERIFDEFDVRGTADASITLRRERNGPFRWEAVVDLIDATLVYKGRLAPGQTTPSGRPMRMGFPYAAQHCYGRLHVTAEAVRLEGIEGRHGSARIRVRGSDELGRDGKETGRILLGDDPDLRLTIEVKDVPVDHDLMEAVEGSEFAGFLDRYRPSGVLDRILLDITKESLRDDVAIVEVDVDLAGAGFVYAPFPLPMTDVHGRVTLLRPRIGATGRGKEFHVAATGLGGGGTLKVEADLLETDRRGRVRVTGTGVHLDDALSRAVLASEEGMGSLGSVWRYLRPSGLADVAADLPALDDLGPESWKVQLRGADVHLGEDAPDREVTIAGLTGLVTVKGGAAAITGIAGTVGGRPLTVEGRMDGGPEGSWDLRLATEQIELTSGLLWVIDNSAPSGSLLPSGILIEPGGHLDLGLHLRRGMEGGTYVLTADVTVRRADLRATVGSLPVRVRGGFTFAGEDVTLEDLTVDGRGIEIRVPRGRLGPNGLEGRLSARLDDLVLEKELLDLLPESIRGTFAEMTKDRLLVAEALDVDVVPNGPLTVRGVLGLKARPKAPPGGAPRGLVELDPVVVSAPDAGGVRELRGVVRMRGVTVDVGTRLDEVTGALEIARLRTGDDPAGEAILRLSTARVAGLTVEGLVVPIGLRDGILHAGPIDGAVYGGRLTADVSVRTRPPVMLEGRAHLEGLRLDLLRNDLGSGPELLGIAGLDVEFQSRSSSFRDFTAAGTATVRDGDLGELPPVANIPALFASLLPKESAKPKFERADVSFVVEDEVLRADCLRLSGPLFDLDGFGTLDFQGRLDLTLTPQFIKSLLLPGSLQLPGVREIVGLFREDSLYVVYVRGDLENAKTIVQPIPFLSRHREPTPTFQGTPFQGKPTRRIPRWFR